MCEEKKEQLRKKNSKKRQQKEWIWLAQYPNGTYMRVGLIHNKINQNPYDVVAVEILNGDGELLQWEMRLDEAQGLIAGLGKVLTFVMLNIGSKGKFLQEYCEFYEIGNHKSK